VDGGGQQKYERGFAEYTLATWTFFPPPIYLRSQWKREGEKKNGYDIVSYLGRSRTLLHGVDSTFNVASIRAIYFYVRSRTS
jgi:hypothetical protein